MARMIAVGDIHGQYDKLVCLVNSIDPSKEDRFIFLGDYIDRGNSTPAVLDWLIEFGRRFPETVFLRGNHEQMLLDAVAACESYVRKNSVDGYLSKLRQDLPDEMFYYFSCGGQETLISYTDNYYSSDPAEVFKHIPAEHLEFISQTELYFEMKGYFFVHAGVDPIDPTGQGNGRQAFLWERRPLWKWTKTWNKIVVHGHTPVKDPYFDDLEINLDTGAGYGRCLTACDVLSRRIWQSA